MILFEKSSRPKWHRSRWAITTKVEETRLRAAGVLSWPLPDSKYTGPLQMAREGNFYGGDTGPRINASSSCEVESLAEHRLKRIDPRRFCFLYSSFGGRTGASEVE